MARSIDPQPKAARGFIPARTDEERYLMRHIEDLARTAFSREIARYSDFLSDREQDLARAALGRAGVQEGFRFDGGPKPSGRSSAWSRSSAMRKAPSAVCGCSAAHWPGLRCPPTRTIWAA